MKVQILEATVEFAHQPFGKPLQLSSGTIAHITAATARVRVRVARREATGCGSIFLSDLWGWPDAGLSHEARDAGMRALCQGIAKDLFDRCGGEAEHPLELGLRLHASVARAPDAVGGAACPPLLARLICASPFDAALHDATGLALERCAFDFYEPTVAFPSADALFASGSACASIRRLLQPPRPALDGWYVASLNDSPGELEPWVRERGYRCFKIKIAGRDSRSDVRRTRAVFAQARALGAENVWLSVDSNCANPDASSVLEFLQRLQREEEATFAALRFVEQPTERDITRHAFDWHAVSRFKPVFLDEGLTGLDVLPVAKEQGWSGLALKTCKGHSFALTAAAWGLENGLQLSVQDLTNPGYAAVHSALLAARLPTALGIELNSPQFTPAANLQWLPRLSALFCPEDGQHRLPDWNPPGLGSTL